MSSTTLFLHLPSLLFFFSLIRPPPSPTLFPYTTLFRSRPPQRALDEDLPLGIQRLPHLAHRSDELLPAGPQDRKSTRLNSSHITISYAVFCLKKKKKKKKQINKKKNTTQSYKNLTLQHL